MKKILILMLALALALTAMPALAAEGDMVLGRGDNMYLRGVYVIGDTVYLNMDYQLMTWKMGEAEPTPMNVPMEFQEYNPDGMYSANSDMVPSDEGLWCVTHMMEYSEQSSRVINHLVSKVEIGEDGTVSMTDTKEIQWPDEMIESYDGREYPVRMDSAWIDGNMLYASNYDGELYAIDLETGKSERINVEYANVFTPYTEGKLLIAGYDYNTQEVQLSIYNMADGSVEKLCATKELNGPEGIAANRETGEVYCLKEGMICTLDPTTGAVGEGLSELPLSPMNNPVGWILDGQYYVINCDGGALVRNLKPETRPTHKLKIVDTTWVNALTDAYFAYSNTHPDVAVNISRDQIPDLLGDMMNRTVSADVIILGMNGNEYDPLYERGFLAELNSEKLDKQMENVYPAIKDRLSKDGKLVAMPVRVYYWPMGVSEGALKRLGLTLDDVPTNWVDFLDFLSDTLPQAMEKDKEVRLTFDGNTVSAVRQMLFGQIFTDYTNYANATMDVISYDTELMRTVLDKLSRLDLEALGVQPDKEEDMNGGMVMVGGSDDSVLMHIGTGASLGEMYDGITPIVMSMDKDSPAIMNLQMYAAVINPFSEEPDLAREFLETLSDELEASVMYNIDPTLTEPVPRPDADEYVKSAQEYYDSVAKDLEEAVEAQKQALEGNLKDAEAWLEEAKRQSWEISAEQIEWFRNHDDNVIVEGRNWLYDDGNGEIYDQLMQYLTGQMDAGQLLKVIDKKVRMMMMEGN